MKYLFWSNSVTKKKKNEVDIDFHANEGPYPLPRIYIYIYLILFSDFFFLSNKIGKERKLIFFFPEDNFVQFINPSRKVNFSFPVFSHCFLFKLYYIIMAIKIKFCLVIICFRLLGDFSYNK